MEAHSRHDPGLFQVPGFKFAVWETLLQQESVSREMTGFLSLKLCNLKQET
jgi:hypothetical protein